MTVSLVEIDKSNLEAVLSLKVAPAQNRLVAPVAVSIAEAHFEPRAWFRAIYANAEPVGFVMLYEDDGHHYVWRLLIDTHHQGKGYGAQAMHLIIERARRAPGVGRVLLSYADRKGNAGPFYRRLGFRETGEIEDDEVVMELVLNPRA